MLKSEMQHQYWLTKTVVQRKFGKKEDECIVSSDAELDAKIELFKSISENCSALYRVVDHFQERVCVLAQEENTLGKFIKEAGKNSSTCGKSMTTTGRAVSYCGQQRMTIRPPLLRLHHEVETFRNRAIADTQATIQAMERERTEYRAALSWIKSVSAQLDPDSGRGVDKFRKAQTHVRISKVKFDKLTLDCLQKIDLLAAARCNMFSHALIAYQSALLEFVNKSCDTFYAAAKSLTNEPHYNFAILKDLTQANNEIVQDGGDNARALDKDQLLFFHDEFKDIDESLNNTNKNELPKSLIDINLSAPEMNPKDSGAESTDKVPVASKQDEDLLNLKINNSDDDFCEFMSAETSSFMPSQLLHSDLFGLTIKNDEQSSGTTQELMPSGSTNEVSAPPTKSKSSIMDLFNKIPGKNDRSLDNGKSALPSKQEISRKDMSAWFQLFSDLDPLANPDAMASKIGGANNSQAA